MHMCRCNACPFVMRWAWQLQAGISRQERAHLAGGSPAIAPHLEDLLAHAGACLPLCYAAGELVMLFSCGAHTAVPKVWVLDLAPLEPGMASASGPVAPAEDSPAAAPVV